MVFDRLKGQSSIEYLMVFGIALLLSAPFIVRAQSSMLDLRYGTSAIEMHNTMNDIESAVKTVSASGSPARRTFSVEIPDNVNSSNVTENAIIYTLNMPEGQTDVIRTFDITFSDDSALPSSSGTYRITVSAKPDGVKIKEVS